jgi:hypothetical protein
MERPKVIVFYFLFLWVVIGREMHMTCLLSLLSCHSEFMTSHCNSMGCHGSVFM